MIKPDRNSYINSINGKKGYFNSLNKIVFTAQDYKEFVIPLSMRYRPDLISRILYGSQKYSWLLSYINGFSNTPKDFDSGITIYYIPKRYLN